MISCPHFFVSVAVWVVGSLRIGEVSAVMLRRSDVIDSSVAMEKLRRHGYIYGIYNDGDVQTFFFFMFSLGIIFFSGWGSSGSCWGIGSRAGKGEWGCFCGSRSNGSCWSGWENVRWETEDGGK